MLLMSFSKKVDFLQKERDELPQRRPVIIYVVAPLTSHDQGMQTSHYKQFKVPPSSGEVSLSLPEGVRCRVGNPFNFCLIEASRDCTEFDTQLASALDCYKEASHKVLAINAHATESGCIRLQGETDTEVVVTGRHLAEVVSTHVHNRFLHVMVFSPYGHIFADSFYSFVQEDSQREVQPLLAVTAFTSGKSPLVWDRLATSGNAHVETKRDTAEFIRNTIEPNSPYKILEGQLMKSQCVML